MRRDSVDGWGLYRVVGGLDVSLCLRRVGGSVERREGRGNGTEIKNHQNRSNLFD